MGVGAIVSSLAYRVSEVKLFQSSNSLQIPWTVAYQAPQSMGCFPARIPERAAISPFQINMDAYFTQKEMIA